MGDANSTPAYEVESLSTSAMRFTVPTWRIASVQCKKGHVLGGLFVIFRPKLDDGLIEGANDEVRRMVGARMRRPYALGMTSAQGYLGPLDFDPGKLSSVAGMAHMSVTEEAGFRYAVMADAIPDSYRFVPGRPCELYLVQHPDRRLAKRILDEINAGSAAYGNPHVITPSADGLLEVGESGDEDPKMFLPAGGDLYGGWCLFRGMPSAGCDEVKRQIRKLVAHLGALRYVVGTGNWPYLFDANTDADRSGGDNDGFFDVRVMNAVFAFQGHASARSATSFQVSDPKPHAALVDYAADFAPKVTRAERTKKQFAGPPNAVDNSWAYLRGKELASVPGPHPEHEDAVVDASTANAIKSWLQNGLRKPGAILVYMLDPRNWGSWIRVEAGQSLFAWSELAKLLGFPEGVCANHCYRSAQVDVASAGFGRAVASIHKSGLAMDVGMKEFVRGDKPWPVAYEQEKTPSGGVRWRVYAPSTQRIPTEAVYEARERTARELGANLQRSLKTYAPPGSGPDEMKAALGPAIASLDAELRHPLAFFERYFKREITPWVYDPFDPAGGKPDRPTSAVEFRATHRAYYLKAQVLPAQETSVKDLSDAVDALRSKLELAVKDKEKKKLQAALEANEKALGKAKAAVGATKADLSAAERTVQMAAQGGAPPPGSPAWESFLDLTLLAQVLGLERIGAFSSGWQRVASPKKSSELVYIAKALESAKARKVEGVVVPVTRGRVTLGPWPLENLDAEFMADWSRKLVDAHKAAPKSVELNPPRLVVRLSLKQSRDADAGAVADVLQQIGDKYLYVTPLEPGGPAVRKASEWAAYLRELGQRLQAAREQRAADDAARKAERERKRKKKGAAPPPEQAAGAGGTSAPDAPVPPDARSKPVLPPLESWMASFQPVFLLEYTPPQGNVVENEIPMMPGDKVGLPADGLPIGMEWWHFQRTDLINKSDASGSWGGLLVAIGWTRECLLRGEITQLHDREGVGYDVHTLDRKAY